MLLTVREKKLILRLLKKERRKSILVKEKNREMTEIINKLEQNLRNENTNETSPDKL